MDSWNDWYELAKKYYEQYNDLNIPIKFKTFDGINYDEKGYKLGLWISSQRRNISKGRLSDDQIKMLKDISFKVSDRNEMWSKMYILAKKYYEYYGNLDIPFRFKTFDGVNYDEKGYKLGFWKNRQKKFLSDNYLSEEKKIKLKSIGLTPLKKNSIFSDNLLLMLQRMIKDDKVINKNNIYSFIDKLATNLVPSKLVEYLYNYFYQVIEQKINIVFKNNVVILFEQADDYLYSKI